MEITERIRSIDWGDVEQSMWSVGYSPLGNILTVSECDSLISTYDKAEAFRATTDMARYRYGRGKYKYFAYPLPALVKQLRTSFYPRLAKIANPWLKALHMPDEFPSTLKSFLDHCHERRQIRPTPLMLKYGSGDYNRLHQDIYGEMVFPFQVVLSLSTPGRDFEGGELLLVEQQPRAQSIGYSMLLGKGEGVLITTRYRPAKGKRGYYRANIKHGVSPIRSGIRYTLGVIFHDAL
jgi:uncharacterized protein